MIKALPRLAGVLASAVLLAAPSVGGRAETAVPGAVCTGDLTCLDQGWTEAQRSWWYTVSQGSRLLPLRWMLALERPGLTAAAAAGPERFLSPANVARLGYLPNPASPANPYGLPLGFAVDHEPRRSADIMCDTFPATCVGFVMRQEWVGMNCAACHTGEISFGGRRLRIEGAPALADFQALEEELLAALEDTLADRARFDRFARAVLGAQMSVEGRAALEAQLAEQIRWQERLADRNRSAVRYGHGRLDAQGHILNKVALTTRVDGHPATVAADAPASYPFIWNTSQQDRIQWNGIASNILKIRILGRETDLGALVRNASEVIGVFAHIETDRGKAARGYESSVRLAALVALERQLATLQSPRWPEGVLPPIDWEKAARGKAHFDAFDCASCHQPLAPDELEAPANEVMDPIASARTDIFLACNAFLHRSASGNFAGQRVFAFTGDTIGPEDFTRNLLINSVVGAVVGKVDELVGSLFLDVFPDGRGAPSAFTVPGAVEYLPGVSDADKKRQAAECLETEHELLAYKARPLNGIWASAPYLHNGSVPTLYDLLLPARVRNRAVVGRPQPEPAGPTRPETFAVGSRLFDPFKVGFRSEAGDPDAPFVFRVRDEASGEPIPGNYNSGHDYGTDRLTEEDRLELVEYLKTL